MSLITARELVVLRATQETAMPGTVVIERYSGTPDGMGGYTQTWAAVGTVTGRIYPRASRGMSEMVGGGVVISETSWFATLPVGTDVTAKDRLLYEARTFEVLRVNNGEMYQTAVRCELSNFNEERRT